MYVCRKSDTKLVVFVTTTGEVTIDANGLNSISATEFSGVEEGWSTSQGFELLNLTGMEIAIPEDYSGDKYKLVENGSGGYDWQMA